MVQTPGRCQRHGPQKPAPACRVQHHFPHEAPTPVTSHRGHGKPGDKAMNIQRRNATWVLVELVTKPLRGDWDGALAEGSWRHVHQKAGHKRGEEMILKTVGTPRRQVGLREARVWWQVMPALDADLMGPKPPCTKGGIAEACAENLAGPHPPFLSQDGVTRTAPVMMTEPMSSWLTWITHQSGLSLMVK